jgi:hypothetical protein
MRPHEAPGKTDYRQLAARMGYGALRRRLKKQAGLWAKETHQGVGVFMVEALLPVDVILAGVLRLARLDGIGLRNLLDIRILENRVVLPGLPPAFEGFRILQITDLHCDLHPPLIDVVIAKLQGLRYDLAAFTGDYHNRIAAPPETSLELMQRVVGTVSGPKYAVLGNHDFIEKVAFLEAVGLPVLLNEAVVIERDGAQLWICGVDDPHFFQTADLVRTTASVPRGASAILLSHSPEPYREAERLGFQLMLSGHTHAGQFCLPGGIPVLRNTRVPRRMLVGAWRHGSLQGYTSRGTGGCGVAARFFCHGEITLHTLTARETALAGNRDS